MTITEKIKKQIIQDIKLHLKSNQIISELRLTQSDDHDNDDSIFKRQNVYNARMSIRRKTLKSLILIQTLLKELKRSA